jgi:hypothetical protein
MLIWAWLGKPNGAAAQFAQSFLAIAGKERADAAICAALEISENVFARPSWCDAFKGPTTVPLRPQRRRSAIPAAVRHASGQLQDRLLGKSNRC